MGAGEDPLALDGVQWLATGPERTMRVPVVGPERTWCAPGFALLAGRSPMLFLCLKRVFPSSTPHGFMSGLDPINTWSIHRLSSPPDGGKLRSTTT